MSRLITFILILFDLCFATYSWSIDSSIKVRNPQQSEHAINPGNYQLGIRMLSPIVDPGGVVKLEVYIIGYGIIKSSKINMFNSTSMFDIDKSSIIYGFDIDSDSFKYGYFSRKMPPFGISISIPEYFVSDNKSKVVSMFSDHEDVNGNPSPILSESKVGTAPFEFNLKTLENINPGTYSTSIYFTYYNGHEWKGGSQQIQFTVRNILQRNELFFALLACLAAAMTILAPFNNSICKLFKFVHRLFEKKTQHQEKD